MADHRQLSLLLPFHPAFALLYLDYLPNSHGPAHDHHLHWSRRVLRRRVRPARNQGEESQLCPPVGGGGADQRGADGCGELYEGDGLAGCAACGEFGGLCGEYRVGYVVFVVVSRGGVKPTVLAQAGIRLACDVTSAAAGLGYFVWVARRKVREHGRVDGEGMGKTAWWWTAGFWLMAKEAVYTFAESAVRNAIYLWLVNRIIGLGADYATAWGVFNTIRWGLVMVPVQALETSALTFVGHQWGVWKKQKEGVSKPAASWKEIKRISRPAINSALVFFGG
ncbi:unnamed protein product [Sordaria macrospora k-hell]|uniref:WGS project CABT00000000 data, contig 2.32 n=1 Tax=Sordaria macrospora (strain ATCC MYA-333 / DSM 997 / K(L3346) / K-hell) TaxID=771870 RepID=F7W5V9_SORMK|nr:uncharacterized protein SMAC_06039 [Sordaria macrospora k-hell]CCC12897.1 unnamed protein product [Sordaria macrospora k-hell]